jgi:APA family basic amino acid/polyamine antiporter
MILSSSRILYQIGTDKLLPKIVRKYNEKRDVAVNGVLISSAIGILMLFSGDIYVMASISNFGMVFCYIMASFALIHFRRKKAHASFRIPFYPYISLAGIGGLIALLIGMPREALIIGVALILALLFSYYTLVEAESRPEERIELFD